MYAQRSGVGQYTKRLVEAMAKTSPKDSFTIFGFKLFIRPLPSKLIAQLPNVHYWFVRFFPGKIYTGLTKLRVRLPLDPLVLRRPDVAFFPNFAVWPFWNPSVKHVVAVHDLSFIHYPNYVSPANREHLLRNVPYAVRRADRIITISLFTKQQIINQYGVDPSKIDLVMPGIDQKEYYKRPESVVAAIRKKYKLPKNYIFFVSTLEPRKNIVGILEAYEQLDANLQKKYALVLVGGKGWLDDSITNKLTAVKQKGLSVITPGYAPDEDLPALYSGASLFVFPSFYEGFGIPILEAMACEVPVVTANNSSLPEVAGDTAIMVEATDSQAITKAIEQVLSDSKLAGQMRAKGLAQVKNFTWEKSAQAALDIFRKLA